MYIHWLSLSLIVVLSSSLRAADWPRWRGPDANGASTETGLLRQWPEGGPPKAWVTQGLGTGYGSVSIAEGRLFVMGRKDNVDYLFARDAATGNPIWETAIGPGNQEHGPNGTPTVDGDRVYGISIAGDLLCADAKTGSEIWRVSFANDFGGRMMSGWGYSESPLIDGDRLICTPGGPQAMIVALDKLSGKTIWKSAIPDSSNRGQPGAGYSSVVISNAGGVKQYVQLVGRGVISVDARTGKFLWGYDKIANPTANVPTPIVSGNYVFASTGYGEGGTALLEIRGSRGEVTPREVYYKPARDLQNHHGGMILLKDKVYMGHGHNNGLPCCIDLKTGNALWGPLRGPGRESAAIAYADGHLYFRYQDGTTALIEASPQAYKVKSSFEEDFGDGNRWAQPVISDGKLYLRTDGTITCYDIRANGAE